MQQGGYLTVGEVLHTIDSHHMQSLYYWIRTRLFEKHTQQKDKLYASGNNSRSMNVMHLYRHDEVSYQDIFGKSI
ncbi:hypothetical protein AGDE_14041 [Angomonas deanei]|nr:hypothetical protein AGDE_14041 [Angomonas deanei]|eukprot:EPY21524.1 hypothetical protein AGDE_14041 [Angomonas deanei]